MTLDNRPLFKGGCQCGAVRFTVEGALSDASVCHCRMCQKAFGNLFAPLVSIGQASLRWTKAEPARFRSSSHVERGFCPACGTPLTYEAPDGVALAIGAFDDPAAIVPTIQFGVEGKLPYADSLPTLPMRDTTQDHAALPWLAVLESYQHPDHDAEPTRSS